jgi:hypothetical protein
MFTVMMSHEGEFLGKEKADCFSTAVKKTTELD